MDFQEEFEERYYSLRYKREKTRVFGFETEGYDEI